MRKNVSEQWVARLVEAGVKRIYAATGDGLNHLNEAVRNSGKIKWIYLRHKEVGAYAAVVGTDLDVLACCAGSCGPGHVHLINGLCAANRSPFPLIAIASTINRSELDMDYFQETNTIKLFGDCSLCNQRITTAAQVLRIFQTAIRHALSKKGVAVIGLSGDLSQEQAIEAPNAVALGLMYNGPALLNVFTNPNALAMPPNIELGQVLGTTKAMTKLVLSGKITEVFETVKSKYKHLKEL